uniref:hypothetical protein n=1 Tax=Enterococcus faecium TaxID=1352 RepID=UPI00287FE480
IIKEGGKISRLKKLIFLDKQVREFCKTANKKPKDKKGVIATLSHFTCSVHFVHSLRTKSKPLFKGELV